MGRFAVLRASESALCGHAASQKLQRNARLAKKAQDIRLCRPKRNDDSISFDRLYCGHGIIRADEHQWSLAQGCRIAILDLADIVSDIDGIHRHSGLYTDGFPLAFE